MKKFYEEPELDITQFNFENILVMQNISNPEAFEQNGYEYEGLI